MTKSLTSLTLEEFKRLSGNKKFLATQLIIYTWDYKRKGGDPQIRADLYETQDGRVARNKDEVINLVFPQEATHYIEGEPLTVEENRSLLYPGQGLGYLKKIIPITYFKISDLRGRK